LYLSKVFGYLAINIKNVNFPIFCAQPPATYNTHTHIQPFYVYYTGQLVLTRTLS